VNHTKDMHILCAEAFLDQSARSIHSNRTLGRIN